MVGITAVQGSSPRISPSDCRVRMAVSWGEALPAVQRSCSVRWMQNLQTVRHRWWCIAMLWCFIAAEHAYDPAAAPRAMRFSSLINPPRGVGPLGGALTPLSGAAPGSRLQRINSVFERENALTAGGEKAPWGGPIRNLTWRVRGSPSRVLIHVWPSPKPRRFIPSAPGAEIHPTAVIDEGAFSRHAVAPRG
ncbi:MAG: hypothetical protein CM15mP77_1770 [Synechococcus sp.]|nr:MAG: hypothetical protein CM15mP77_1770 [Synechococcus sp.]